jgi:hypothetical protein
MDAGLNAFWRSLDMVRELTGSPVSMYARTIEFKIS